MKKYLALLAVSLFIVGCGSDSKTYNTYEENITEPYVVPDGMTVIVDGATDSTVTTDVESQVITIDCGGSCGNINIGVPLQ